MTGLAAAPSAHLPFPARTLGDIAVSIPGATALFRRHKLDFCCGGTATLADAVRDKDLPIAPIVAALEEMSMDAQPVAPQETPKLIDHILDRYHATHRRELPELIKLARKVEAVHAAHPLAPVGLADALVDLSAELETHMAKEELILFPMMRAGGSPMIAHPIARMRHEHEEHGMRLRVLLAMTDEGRMPDDACRSWQALTSGVRKLVADVMDHVALENDLLFPRFAAKEPEQRT
ncbi:MAG: iron-sulfur cluster repair di-iron protein, partial [Alphaproteobacteria bacterium]|nr:iron-sulfur cluster repair di-iron protein [Alphaproteobacteria bacterium]